MTVTAYAAPTAGAPLQRTVVQTRDVGEFDVLIDVKFAGICQTDIHLTREGWGPGIFPMVPGHEIAGVVAQVGAGVSKHQVGDRVGVGCLVDSCRECANCVAGQEQLCLKGATQTYGSIGRDGKVTYGGYATHVTVDEHFVVRIPDSLALDVAAPLLCAGITTYAPLKRWGVGPGSKVAVVGLGGLGHVAVKIAHAMGAEVTVLSQSLRKKDDGLALGAAHYHATSDADTFTALAGTFDVILSTVSAPLDLNAYLAMAKTGGVMVNVGVPDDASTFSLTSLIFSNKILTGSMIGGVAQTQEMLDFCAEHSIGAQIETIAAADVNEAYERVLASDVRFRFVIDTSTI